MNIPTVVKTFIPVLILALLLSFNCSAGFKIKPVFNSHNSAVITKSTTHKHPVLETIRYEASRLKALMLPYGGGGDGGGTPAFGIASACAAVLGIALVVVAFSSWSVPLFWAGSALAIIALPLGIVGLIGKPMKGLALAGTILGGVYLAYFLIAMLLVAAISGAYWY